MHSVISRTARSADESEMSCGLESDPVRLGQVVVKWLMAIRNSLGGVKDEYGSVDRKRQFLWHTRTIYMAARDNFCGILQTLHSLSEGFLDRLR